MILFGLLLFFLGLFWILLVDVPAMAKARRLKELCKPGNFTKHGIYYIIGKNKTLRVSGVDPKLTIAIIPDTIRHYGIKYTVIGIGDSAFLGSKSLIRVILCKSIVSIEDKAFWGCESLIEIEIPDSVVSIGKSAFFSCKSLVEIEIPDSVVSIGESAFFGCKNLVYVSLSKKVVSIEESAFWGCESLIEIEIPDSVTSIGESAFCNCNSLVKVTLSKNISSIEKYLFACTALEKIEIPDKVTLIGESAFAKCAFLRKIFLGRGVTEIRADAFAETKLSRIVFPESVVSIDKGALKCCFSLREIYFSSLIPPKVSYSLINFSFENIIFYFPKGYIDSYKRTLIDLTEKFDLESVIDEWDPFSLVTVGNIVYTLDTSSRTVAVWDLVDFKIPHLVIPASIEYDEVHYSVSKIERYALAHSCISKIEIPGTVRLIGEFAFMNSLMLQEVVLSKGLIDIEKSAFENCQLLSQIEIPEGVVTIGEGAFRKCSRFGDIVFPASVERIESFILDECNSIKKVYFKSKVPPQFDIGAFLGCSSDMIIYYPREASEKEWKDVYELKEFTHKVWDCILVRKDLLSCIIDPTEKTAMVTNCFSTDEIFTIPDSIEYKDGIYPITKIGLWAFYAKKSLKQVVIPKSVTLIEREAFYACTSLHKIYFKSEVPPETEPGAFLGRPSDMIVYCPKGTEVEWKKQWKSFNIQTWNSEPITIHDGGITYMLDPVTKTAKILKCDDDYLNYLVDCSITVRDTTIPGSGKMLMTKYAVEYEGESYPVQVVGKGAFFNCKQLENIWLWDIYSIEMDAFSYCISLKTIFFIAKPPAATKSAFYACPKDLLICYHVELEKYWQKTWSGFRTATFRTCGESMDESQSSE